MGTVEDQGELEKASAEAIIAAAEPFPDVESVHIDLGEDHTGDPSMWITFRLRPEIDFTDDWFRAYNEYSTRLSIKLLHSGITRFPYTRLESAG